MLNDIKDIYYIDSIRKFCFDGFEQKFLFFSNMASLSRLPGLLLVRGEFGDVQNVMPGTMTVYLQGPVIILQGLGIILGNEEFDLKEGTSRTDAHGTEVYIEYLENCINIYTRGKELDINRILSNGVSAYCRGLFDNIRKYERLSGINRL